LSAAADKLPERFYGPTNGGPLAALKVDREAHEWARKYYYQLMGWDAAGVPTPQKLAEMGIEK
jgi:aldehyde:ferredoxin oxidoreductase